MDCDLVGVYNSLDSSGCHQSDELLQQLSKALKGPQGGRVPEVTKKIQLLLESTSWGYADDHGMDDEFGSTVERKNHGASQIG